MWTCGEEKQAVIYVFTFIFEHLFKRQYYCNVYDGGLQDMFEKRELELCYGIKVNDTELQCQRTRSVYAELNGKIIYSVTLSLQQEQENVYKGEYEKISSSYFQVVGYK